MRHNAIVSNIANVDTPDYKAFHVHVEKAMRPKGASDTQISLQQTHPVHMTARRPAIYSTRNFTSEDRRVSRRGDGNTVDIDRAMSNLAENNIMYEAAVQLVKRKFESIKLAINGGK